MSSTDNHFTLFSLPERFDLDTAVLEERSRDLLGRWHPDRFTAASDAEKRRAMQMTSIINEASDTLGRRLSRAGYLLKLRGVDVDAFAQAELAPAFLLQQMALRDELEDVAGADDIDALEALRAGTRAELDALYVSFERAVQEQDVATAKTLFHQAQFLEKLLVEINQTEERLLDY